MIGVPLRDSTQWDLIKSLADDIGPVYSALEKLAAQGKVIAHDDTSVRILSCIKENKTKQPGERTGMFTTSIVSQFQDYRICLFYPGRKHSGENIADLMIGIGRLLRAFPPTPPYVRVRIRRFVWLTAI